MIVVVAMVTEEDEGEDESKGYSWTRLAGVEMNKKNVTRTIHCQASAGHYAVWHWEVRKREKSIMIQI